MRIKRHLEDTILAHLEPGRVVVLYGPRRSGKTTVLEHILPALKGRVRLLSGEDIVASRWLSSQHIRTLQDNIGDIDILIIDEAQLIDKIGINLKLIVDHIPSVRVIATGSSSFELANQVGEPLVGRKWQYTVFPIAQLELSPTEAPYESLDRLESRLIYGSYPEVIVTTDRARREQLLHALVDNYLFRDVFILERMRKPYLLIQLLQLLAFQIGQEVSQNELATQLGVSQKTVERYLDLLEKVFVIKRVGGFSRNLRKEIRKSARYYFYDNGVRNALINNLNPLSQRNDIGMLWENYLFMERVKKQCYLQLYSNNYFWRTYDQQEVDLVEERGGKLYGYEFKWSTKSKKPPKAWLENYENAEYEVITPDNYLGFIT